MVNWADVTLTSSLYLLALSSIGCTDELRTGAVAQSISDEAEPTATAVYFPDEDRTESLGVVDVASLAREKAEHAQERERRQDPVRRLDRYAAEADAVVIGVVDSVHCAVLTSEDRDSIGTVAERYTTFVVSIGETFIGDEGEFVSGLVPGGSCGGGIERWSGAPDVAVGSEHLLFLGQAGPLPSEVTSGDGVGRHILHAFRVIEGRATGQLAAFSVDELRTRLTTGGEI